MSAKERLPKTHDALLRVIAAPRSWQLVCAYMPYHWHAGSHDERVAQSWDNCPSWWFDVDGRRVVTATTRRLKAAGLIELEPVQAGQPKVKRTWELTDAGRAYLEAHP